VNFFKKNKKKKFRDRKNPKFLQKSFLKKNPSKKSIRTKKKKIKKKKSKKIKKNFYIPKDLANIDSINSFGCL
jgi:hypothetical protein